MKILRLLVLFFCLPGFFTIAAAAEHPVVSILAFRDGEIVRLERQTNWRGGNDFLAVAFDAQLADLAENEKASGLEPLFSLKALLESLEVSGESALSTIRVDTGISGLQRADLQERFSWMLDEWLQWTPGVETLSVRILGPSGAEIRIENAAPPQISKPEEFSLESFLNPATTSLQTLPHGNAQPMGALSDASIFLSPGHGWHYNSNLGRWATQRGNNFQIIEDLSNGEAVLQYLHQYLWNAGARIYTTRERDRNTNMVIVNHGGAGYSQTGSWTVQSAGGAYGGSHRYATTVSGPPTATARFTPNIPEAGHYAVYVWYRTASGGTTTADARITINHTGDSTLWVQDQARDGFTWKYIGTYYFEEGRNPETGSVVIDNQSSVAGRRVIAGAVRFGGGMGDMADNTSGTVSGKPRWEESGRYYAGFLGKSDWASFGTVNAMPRWAAWEHESWESGKSVYVSWHTNAAGGTGTETYAFSNRSDGAFNGVAGGDRLRNFIHDHVIRDARARWKSNWTDRGKKTANFGEINPNNNSAMPAALIEIGFHDREEDAKYLLDPEFRRDMARAVYKGLVQFYANELPGFNNATYLPEPPRNFRVSANAEGSVELSWIPPVFGTGPTSTYGHAATGYRVYRSKNGYGFNNGTAVAGTSATLSGFAPGETVFLRVSATNAGGESFPTSTLAVRIPDASEKKLLIVNGFTRNDRFMNTLENDPHSSNPVSRGYADRLNTGNYIIPHARAIEAYPKIVGFDSAEVAAVEANQVLLGDYDAVVWMAGLQAQVNDIGNPVRQTPAFSSGLKGRIAQYQAADGQLFVSGSEIASDVVREGVAGWLSGILKARYVAQLPATGASGWANSFLSGWTGSLGPGGAKYPLDRPDVIEPAGGSSGALIYSGSVANVIDGFESVSGWWQPGTSGTTTGAGTFSAVSSPAFHGNASARLEYDWTPGNHLRVHNPSQPQFSADSNLSIWVRGDGSGHLFRLSVRDSDGELFANAYTPLNFTGRREIVWEDIRNNATRWAGTGDGVVTGPLVGLESLQLQRPGGGPVTGAIHVDYAVATPVASGGDERVAAVQYEAHNRLFYMAFPFEKIADESGRADLMARVLDFFRFDRTPFESWQEEHFTENELADPEISGAEANPAGDGIPNILKYALNLDPRQADRSGLPEVSVEEGALTLRLDRAKRATDVDFVVEVSEDLVSWFSGENEIEFIRAIDQGETERITVRDRTAFPETGRRFMRLRVGRE